MSDVKRWPAKMFTPETPCVHATDFDAAQSEIAALREELERQKHYVEINANSAHGKHKEGQQYKDERDALREDLAAIIANRNDLKQRLTVTEQRNAELVELLKKSRRSIDPSCSGKALRMELDAALKPTESGVSDKCVSDGGTCGLGGQCAECPHKESGASE